MGLTWYELVMDSPHENSERVDPIWATATMKQSLPSLRKAAKQHGARRTIAKVASTLAIVALAGCAKDPAHPVTSPVRWGTGTIDFALAWSRDGQWIAFRRTVPSSYGPPGLYLVDRTGSVVRHIYSPAGQFFFFPREASFSPDGGSIAAVDVGRQMIIVDLPTLNVHRPLYTQGEVWSPNWSADGHTILYSQLNAGSFTTDDSVGLFIFDVTASMTRPLRWGSGPIYSMYARLSPDGRLVAMDELAGPVEGLGVMNADGTGHSFLIQPRSGQLFRNIDWYHTPLGGPDRILFWSTQQPGAGPYLVNPDGSGLAPFWHRIQSEGFLSPTGTEYVRGSPDPASHYWVLYVGRIDDVTDVALRQVTRYEP